MMKRKQAEPGGSTPGAGCLQRYAFGQSVFGAPGDPSRVEEATFMCAHLRLAIEPLEDLVRPGLLHDDAQDVALDAVEEVARVGADEAAGAVQVHPGHAELAE